MKPVLVIGYGNPTRSDDGVGWYVADEIEKAFSDRVDVLKAHQLTLEMAEDIKDRELVIFVDARADEGGDWIRSEKLSPDFKLGLTVHHLTPEVLLGACEGLFNKIPEAYIFSIKGVNFDFGEKLSEQTRNAADRAIEQIKGLILKECPKKLR